MESAENLLERTAEGLSELPSPAEAVGHLRAEAKNAACHSLEKGTGWRWDASELGHFRTSPKSFSMVIKQWRNAIVLSAAQGNEELLSIQAGRPQIEIRSKLDDALAVLREIARILLVSQSIPRSANALSAEEENTCTSETKDKVSQHNNIAKSHTGADRVINRLNPFYDLGVETDRTAQSELAAPIWHLVPPPMVNLLKARLERHAEEVCPIEHPSCESCELAKFCRRYRDSAANIAEASDKPIFIDLFCGAGGISLGFGHEGYRPILAIDANDAACVTYRTNHCDIADKNVLCADIREVFVEDMKERLCGRNLDVLIGAPPCQGFSNAGMRSKQALVGRTSLAGYSLTGDKRNYFFQLVVSAAAGLKPKLVLMENVPGMDSARPNGAPSFMRLAEKMLREAGFLTVVWKLDAAGYGVPQRRIRTFLVGSSVGRLPALPEAEFQHSATKSIDPDALPSITVEAALFDRPSVQADGGETIMASATSGPKVDRRYRYYLRNKRFPICRQSNLIFNHKCRYNNPKDLELYSLLKPGEDSVHIIERYGRGDLMRYRRDVFDDKYARLRPDKPSKTIVSHLAKDGNSYVHPTQTRSITPREGARLQSFPDDFVFCGSPSEQWTQIGNSVPPALAAAIARSFRELLDRDKTR